jgi:enoyl-[acyl-carrier protein] reductase I
MDKILRGKVAVISGVANDMSIAWATAKKLHEAGAEVAFTYQGEKVKERVEALTEHMKPKLMISCDVTNDADLDNLGKAVLDTYGKADIFVHSLAFASKDDLHNDFYKTTRAGFSLAHDISAYSLIAMSRAMLPAFQQAGGGSIIYMTYYGAEKAIPSYKIMGVAKASLEACGMYLAQDLGRFHVRVNGISAGPIKTLAARGIANFSDLQKQAEKMHPLVGKLGADDVADTALYLASDLADSMTGEVLHVDRGFHIIAH